MPSDVVGWKPFVQSWLTCFFARQHAASQQPPAAPAAEPSRLPEQQQSVMTVDGCSSEAVLKHTSTAGSQAGVAKALRSNDSCNGIDTASSSLECPQDLQGVYDFIWGLFEKFVEPLLQWVAAHGNTLLPVVPVAQLLAVTVLFETQAEALRCAMTWQIRQLCFVWQLRPAPPAAFPSSCHAVISIVLATPQHKNIVAMPASCPMSPCV
jgi:hypothetical protein